MCVIAADISSSCLAAGAEGGDGILGSASCRGAAKAQTSLVKPHVLRGRRLSF